MEVQLDCLHPLCHPIEWDITYIANPCDSSQDQLLDHFTMDPLNISTICFTLEIPPIQSTNIPKQELLNVAGLTLVASYQQQQFFICGYYVNNYIHQDYYHLYYDDQNNFKDVHLDLQHVVRHINTESPRITRKNIDWADKTIAQLQIEGVPLNQMLVEGLQNQNFNQNQITNDNFGQFMNSNNFNNLNSNMQNTFEMSNQYQNHNIFDK